MYITKRIPQPVVEDVRPDGTLVVLDPAERDSWTEEEEFLYDETAEQMDFPDDGPAHPESPDGGAGVGPSTDEFMDIALSGALGRVS